MERMYSQCNIILHVSLELEEKVRVDSDHASRVESDFSFFKSWKSRTEREISFKNLNLYLEIFKIHFFQRKEEKYESFFCCQ